MSRSTEFDLSKSCREVSPEILKFWQSLVEAGQISLNQGGGDHQLLNAAIKASQSLIAYGYGQPSQRHEITGKDGGPISFDASKLSDATLQEILEARRK